VKVSEYFFLFDNLHKSKEFPERVWCKDLLLEIRADLFFALFLLPFLVNK